MVKILKIVTYMREGEIEKKWYIIEN